MKFLALFLFLGSFQMSFHEADFAENISNRYGTFQNYSENEKKTLCLNKDTLACVFYLTSKINDKESTATELIAEIDSMFPGIEEKGAAYYMVLARKWKQKTLDSATIKAAIENLPDSYKSELYTIYLKKLYQEEKFDTFLAEFTPQKEEELNYNFVMRLIEKEPMEALKFIRENEISFSDGSFNKIESSIEKSNPSSSLKKEMAVLSIANDFRKIKYPAVIAGADRFKEDPTKDLWAWRADLYKAMTYTRKREHETAVKIYSKLESVVRELEIPDRDLYNFYRWSGFSYATLNNDEKSVELYYKGYQTFMGRRVGYAADFLYRAGDMERLSGNFSKASRYYRILSANYPKFEELETVHFLLFWLEYKESRYDNALQALDNIMKNTNEESYSYKRALYWSARIYEKTGKKDKSIALYKKTAYATPGSFYGALAASRLKNIGVELNADEVKSPNPQKNNEPKSGLFPEINWIMAFLYSPYGKDEVYLKKLIRIISQKVIDKGSDEEKMILSYAAKESGYDELSMKLARAVSTSDEVTEKYLKLQYPILFEEDIVSHADFYKVPSLFVFSIARQESLFNHKAVSVSNAIGLLQLLPETANLLAKNESYGYVGIEDLKNPLTNIRFGVKFLGQLLNDFDGSIPLASGSYNAGPGKIRKWIKRNPEAQVDEFVEDIPIFQTRNYVKKVLGNYAMYHYLYTKTIYDGVIFELPQK